MEFILTIIGIIVLIICVILIYYLNKKDILIKLLYKINLSEGDIKNKLNNKCNLLNRAVTMIIQKLRIDIKSFELLKLPSDNLYDKDKELTQVFNDVKKIYDDNYATMEIAGFKEVYKDIEKTNLNLCALRTLYNMNASLFNNLVRKFPYNIIYKFKKYGLKSLYEGEELKENKDSTNIIV